MTPAVPLIYGIGDGTNKQLSPSPPMQLTNYKGEVYSYRCKCTTQGRRLASRLDSEAAFQRSLSYSAEIVPSTCAARLGQAPHWQRHLQCRNCTPRSGQQATARLPGTSYYFLYLSAATDDSAGFRRHLFVSASSRHDMRWGSRILRAACDRGRKAKTQETQQPPADSAAALLQRCRTEPRT